MPFEEFCAKQRAWSATQQEAAELPGVDVRTVRRWTRRYEARGPRVSRTSAWAARRPGGPPSTRCVGR